MDWKLNTSDDQAETTTTTIIFIIGTYRFPSTTEYNLSVLPFMGGRAPEHKQLRPFPTPSFPALSRQDATPTWRIDTKILAKPVGVTNMQESNYFTFLK